MSLPFPEGSWCVDCSFATDKLEAVQTGPKMVVEKLNVFASDVSRPVFTQADAVDLDASNATTKKRTDFDGYFFNNVT